MTSAEPKKPEPRNPRLTLLDLTEQDVVPKVTIYVLDRAGHVTYSAPVDSDGAIKLGKEVLAKARLVRIGPATSEPAESPPEECVTYRAAEVAELLATGGDLAVPRDHWLPWIHVRRCVHGKVSNCRPFFWALADLVAQALPDDASIRPMVAAQAKLSRFPRRCYPICDGMVEVYRRICCHRPWIIDDPRLPDLIREIEELVVPWPPEPWPPGPDPIGPDPGPDPLPWLTERLFKSGTLDQRGLNAARDLKALKQLPKLEQPAYLEVRPYLWWHRCGKGSKVATGTIQPDGRFSICWREPLRPMLVFCHEQFAYVVKQVINGETVTIYDGVAANAWFSPSDEAELVAFSRRAVTCGQDPGPDIEGNFVLLQDIGLAHSYRLKTPNAAGWDRVAAPGYNDGLLDPAPTASDALGNYLNSNWGGTLALRYEFSESMKALGAKYYRVSVSAADAYGNPTGPRKYLAGGLSWYYYEVAGSSINILSSSLGPQPVNEHATLYQIPYHADRDWMSGQFHAYLDTTQFGNGRHLVTLELFDDAGVRIRPAGTAAIEASDQECNFTFRRWEHETGPTTVVDHAALTHMLWWDNRRAVAEITDLRLNGTASTAECQFIEGCGTDRFSAGYRAYHPEPPFLHSHWLRWKRGLHGSVHGISSTPNQSVGVPTAAPAESASSALQDMLAGLAQPRCSFALLLDSYVKTTNGIGVLINLYAYDQAAFALATRPCLPVVVLPAAPAAPAG